MVCQKTPLSIRLNENAKIIPPVCFDHEHYKCKSQQTHDGLDKHLLVKRGEYLAHLNWCLNSHRLNSHVNKMLTAMNVLNCFSEEILTTPLLKLMTSV